jgi:ubiquinone/menaquinone biosynthesis C-methylase UbiE
MDPIEIFSSKAEIYAKYRWGYAPEAIQTIFDLTGISQESCVADIGAGTGILTREFIGKVKQVFAVEPNPEMRAIADRQFAAMPSCRVIDGRAEATTLAGNSVDLITAAQAVHWFEPESAMHEFYRILKPNGWLALCRNYGTDHVLTEALQDVYPAENDTESLMVGKRQSRSIYFDDQEFLKLEFPFSSKLKWEGFLGSLSSASFAPDVDTIAYEQFARKAKSVFNHFNTNRTIDIHGMTELYLGRIRKS